MGVSVLVTQLSDSVTPWTIARQASLSIGFSRQNTGVGSLSRFPGNLPDSGIKPGCPMLQADSLLSEPPGKPLLLVNLSQNAK